MVTLVLISRTIIGFIELILIKIITSKNELKNLDKYIVLLTIFLINSSILNYKDNILYYEVPIISILLLRKLLLIIYNDNKKVKNIFEKDPILIVKNGKVIYKNLLSKKYSLNSLTDKLKDKGYTNIEKIKYGFIEDDNIYVIENNEKKQEEPVIIDNKINNSALKKLNINKKTIETLLLKENIDIKDIMYGIYKNNKLYIIRNSLLK
jgi:uncharacterized membrane protein YcaP (DUF421 family)